MSGVPKDERQEGDEQSGLECRECGCRHFVVVYTRRDRLGRIRRRRQCRYCGKRITTIEKEQSKP